MADEHDEILAELKGITTKLGQCEKKIDKVEANQVATMEKLWGKNGFEGDIVEIKGKIDKASDERAEIKDGMGGLCERLGKVEEWKSFLTKAIIAVLGTGAVGSGITAAVKLL